MKERPILFSGPMVRAILEGRKMQTRRIMKKQPTIDPQTGDWLFTYSDGSQEVSPIERWAKIQAGLHCPYGKPGDQLWVRETWRQFGAIHLYRSDYKDGQDICAWKPSIHMPRIASRITLEIVNVRVERLQDISEEDAIAEGCITQPKDCDLCASGICSAHQPPIGQYRTLWQSINGPESWAQNPWVWVVEFKRV